MNVLALLAVCLSLVLLQPEPTASPVNPGDITPPPTATFAPDDTETLAEVASARFDASTYAPLVGEPFNLQLRVTLPAGAELAAWPEIPEDWGPFQVLERSELTRRGLPNDRVEVEQILTVLLWRPGGVDTPETFIGYSFGGGETLNIPARSAFIAVPSVLDPEDLNLRPLLPPVDLPYLSPLFVFGVAVAIGGLGWLGYDRWRKRPSRVVEVVALSPAESARAALDLLRDQTDVTPEHAYQQTADVLRVYLRDRFSVAAPDLTTAETLGQLAPLLPEELLKELERILSRADLVKFAGSAPEMRSVASLVEYARRWLDAVEQQTPLQNNAPLRETEGR